MQDRSDFQRLTEFVCTSLGFIKDIVQDKKLLQDEDGKIYKIYEEINSYVLKEISVEPDKLTELLKEKGLSSMQLDFKLQGFYELIDKWQQHSKWSDFKIKSIAKYIFKWINFILGSLMNVFPGLEMLKEFKERIELIIDADDLVNSFKEFGFLKL